MRIDKFLSVTGTATRKEAEKAARAGRIFVNGESISSVNRQINPLADKVAFDGEMIEYRENYYIMLNKPEGFVSATEDGRDATVLELLPERLQRLNLFPCGRLDKNTLGLMLLTDNGELAHRLLTPKRHVEKKYFFKCRAEVSDAEREELESGLILADGYETRPAEVELYADRMSGIITLHEGKYHQIKRMFGAVNDNRIIYLERISFGPLILDPALPRGGWRFLDESEILSLKDIKAD